MLASEPVKKLLTQDEINRCCVYYAGSCESLFALRAATRCCSAALPKKLTPCESQTRHLKLSPESPRQLALRPVRASHSPIAAPPRKSFHDIFARRTGEKTGWREVTPDTTIAIYMPGTDYAEVAARLLDAVLGSELPCAVISNATRAEQQIRWSSVGALFEEQRLPAPAILIVGRESQAGTSRHRRKSFGG